MRFFVAGNGGRMKFDPDIHRRRSIRLRDYDYAAAGYYFVTICVQGRECLLGAIVNDMAVVNEAGGMVDHWWNELPNKFGTVELDRYVIMPNHFHGIIILQSPAAVGANLCVRPGFRRSEIPGGRMGPQIPGGHAGPPLPQVVQWFKTMTTNAYINGAKKHDWPPFPGKLWQRNYYEQVIRNDRELRNIRQYIRDNPAKWDADNENPANHPTVES